MKGVKDDLKKLFGPPPLLSGERAQDFYEILEHYLSCLGVDDFVVAVQIYHVAVHTFLLHRWVRFQTLAIAERECAAQDLKLTRKDRKTAESHPDRSAPPLRKRDEFIDAAYEMRAKVHAEADVAISNSKEIDSVAAYEQAAQHVHQLDRLIDTSNKRLHFAMLQIQWYRENLRLAIGKVADEFLEKANKIREQNGQPALVPEKGQAA